MNLQVFEYLLALEKYESFSRASDACGISQPALSMQIKKFEKELNVNLIERLNKGFVFTNPGLSLLNHARVIMNEIHQINKLSEDLSDPYIGNISLGAFPTLAPFLFPKIANDLVETYPNLKFYLIEEKTNILVSKLEKGEIDAAFLALPEKNDLLEYAEVFEEEFLLAVPKNHSLAKINTMKADDLAPHELLLLEDGHCLRGQALDFCQAHGASESIDFRASSLSTLLEMIAMGNAITLVPSCAAVNDKIHFIPFSEPKPSRQIALFWRKSSIHAPVFREIADDIRRNSSFNFNKLGKL